MPQIKALCEKNLTTTATALSLKFPNFSIVFNFQVDFLEDEKFGLEVFGNKIHMSLPILGIDAFELLKLLIFNYFVLNRISRNSWSFVHLPGGLDDHLRKSNQLLPPKVVFFEEAKR